MRKSLFTLFLVAASLSLGRAQDLTSYSDLRKMVDSGLRTIESNLYIEGYCTVIGNWGNIAQNQPRHYTKTATSENYRTAYIQNEDATYGFCIKGRSKAMFSQLKMGDRITFNLKGTTICKTGTGMYVISNLEQNNVLRCYSAGATALKSKPRFLNELTDADLCTYVTLKDCEFLFKDGAYINIYETYAQKAPNNAISNPNESMDGWASLLCDSKGNTIYTVANTATSWRRNGKGVPSGKGTVSGTLLADPFPRYSAFPIGYQIRCMNETYYNMSEPSNYKIIAEWNWNNQRPEFNTTSGARKTLDNSAIVADLGEGKLFCEVSGNIIRDRDYNNPRIEKLSDNNSKGEKGIVTYGAMSIRTSACNWWNWEKNEGKGIVAVFSTEDIKGEHLIFGFTFGGGNLDPETSVYFPAYWKIQYSIDGETYRDVDGKEISCRSVPWYWGRPIKGQYYSLSYECGLGYTDHMVVLPADCFGQKSVYVKVIPARRNAATYSVTSSDKAAITKGFTKTTVVSFGSIVVRYN